MSSKTALGLNWSNVLAFTAQMAIGSRFHYSLCVSTGDKKDEQDIVSALQEFCLPDSTVASREDDASKFSQRIAHPPPKKKGCMFPLTDKEWF